MDKFTNFIFSKITIDIMQEKWNDTKCSSIFAT